MINSVHLYGKLKGRVDIANSRSGKLKLNFELAVRRPPGVPAKFEGGKRLPDFVPVTAQGTAAEIAMQRLGPWIENGNGVNTPYISVNGIWATRLAEDRVYHECLVQTLVVHDAPNGHDPWSSSGPRTEGDTEETVE
jgi:hypothetical protein